MNRRVIYVDASIQVDVCKISLFDQKIEKLEILEGRENISIATAEKYAILYACLYSIKNNLERVHILNDNKPATENSKIVHICDYLNLSVSWIPREVNLIADKGTKSEINVDGGEFKILSMFYNLIMDFDIPKELLKTKKESQDELEPTLASDINKTKQTNIKLMKDNSTLKNQNSALKAELNNLKQKVEHLTKQLNQFKM